MIYVIQGKNGKDAYKMEPRGKGSCLCYELYFWRDAYTDKSGNPHEGLWKTTGKFPRTVAHGMRCIARAAALGQFSHKGGPGACLVCGGSFGFHSV